MSSTVSATTKLPQAGTYTVDPAHTEVGFVARHLIGTKVRGRFTEASGTFTVAEKPEESTLEAEVKTASIHTNQSMRDDHLRTNDFFDAENHPTITVKSTGLKKITDAEWKLSTDLTIRGVTKPVVLAAEGPTTFDGLQHFLSSVHILSTENRLLRHLYFATKP